MKIFLTAAVFFPLLLGSCVTQHKPEEAKANSVAEKVPATRQVFFSYHEGARYCYARFIENSPYDKICLKGSMVTYDSSAGMPAGFKPMPDYVTALFNAKKPPLLNDTETPSPDSTEKVGNDDPTAKKPQGPIVSLASSTKSS